jgi:hypothetical protein
VSRFKTYVKWHEVDDEVNKFEETALFYSNTYKLHGPDSKFRDPSDQTPSLTRGSSTPFSVCSNSSKRSPLDSGDIQVHNGEDIQDFLREFDILEVAT